MILVSVSHSEFFEWRAGFINLRQPSTHELEDHLSPWSVKRTHATRSHSLSILTFHPGGDRSTETALHHEVLHPTALLPVVGVPQLFSSHHRGKWEQTCTYLTLRRSCVMGICRTSTSTWFPLKKMFPDFVVMPSRIQPFLTTSYRILWYLTQNKKNTFKYYNKEQIYQISV